MIPNSINMNIDVPIEFKATSQDGCSLFLMNITHRITVWMSVLDNMATGEKTYSYCNTFPLVEGEHGLMYFDCGWKIMDQKIQQVYSDYVADNEILGDK